MRSESKKLSSKAEESLEEYNWGDWMLYDFFVAKLKKEVKEIGEQKVEYYKNQIIKRSAEISDECLQEQVSGHFIRKLVGEIFILNPSLGGLFVTGT